MSTDLPPVSKSHNEGTTQPLSVFSMWSGGQVVRWSGGQVVRWSGDQVARWPMVPGHRPSDKWPMATGHPTLARNQFAHLVGLWRRQETCTFTIYVPKHLLILNVMLLERFGLNLSHLVEHRADGFIKRFGL